MKCKICSNLTIEAQNVVLLSLLLTFNIFDALFWCVFCWFEHVNDRWNTLLPNLNLSMPFRIGFRSPVTFKTKLYVTTVNNNFQPLPIFCHKELHLRCCIGLELNIVTWYTKILKGIGDHSHQMPHPMIKCNLEKIWKTNPRRCPKNTLPEIFCIH